MYFTGLATVRDDGAAMKTHRHPSPPTSTTIVSSSTGRPLGRLAAVAGLIVGFATSGFAAGILTPKGSPDKAGPDDGSPRQRHAQQRLRPDRGHRRRSSTPTRRTSRPSTASRCRKAPASPRSRSPSANARSTARSSRRRKPRRSTRTRNTTATTPGSRGRTGSNPSSSRSIPSGPRSQTRLRFVYYQPLEIDTGVGRYVYPLEEGGTDDAAGSFWDPVNAQVEGTFSAAVELKSAWPVADVRVPGFEKETVTDKVADGHYTVRARIARATP